MSLTCLDHHEMLRVLPFSRCSCHQQHLRAGGDSSEAACPVALQRLASSPSAPKPDGLFSLQRSFSLGTAVIAVCGGGGTVGSAWRCPARGQKVILAGCSILVPTPWGRHHIPQELSLPGLSPPQ